MTRHPTPDDVGAWILYEDNHLLVVRKPAGVPSQPDQSGDPDLFTLCREYIRIRYKKPGEAYLGLIHRLDRSVSGVTLFAKTSKAAARLAEQFRNREISKIYRALCEGRLHPQSAELTDTIVKDEARRIARAAKAGEAGEAGQTAKLRYRVIQNGEFKGSPISFVEIELLTGRFHQIRYQLSAAGAPILGDKKYGATLPFPGGIALHACTVEFIHPVRREPMRVDSPVPESWPISEP